MQPINIINGSWKQGVEPKVVNLTGTAFMEEAGAHKFVITAQDESGAEIPFTGTISALFLRADNTTVAIDGTINSGKAEIVLVADCYHVAGRFSVAIYVSDGTDSACVYAAVGNIYRTSSDVVIDSGAEIPTLAQLQAAYQACIEATEQATNAVSYETQTGKTDAQKSTARTNIGAASEQDVTDLRGAVIGDTYNLYHCINKTKKINNVDITTTIDNHVTATGTATANGGRTNLDFGKATLPAGTYYFSVANMSSGTFVAIMLSDSSTNVISYANTSFTLADETDVYLVFNVVKNSVYSFSCDIQITQGSSAKEFIKPVTAVDEIARRDIQSIEGQINRYIVVDVNGGGDYTSLSAAVEYAFAQGNYTLFVKAGTYNILTELDFADKTSLPGYGEGNNNAWGLKIGNNMHIICENGVVFSGLYDGTDFDIKTRFSMFNVAGSYTIENMEIEIQNLRYCIHEDTPTLSLNAAYISKIINCRMRHKGGYTTSACLGCGDANNSLTIIQGGEYKSDDYDYPISMHNHTGNKDGRIIVDGVYFANGTVRLAGFSSTDAGDTLHAVVRNCRLCDEIFIDDEPTKIDLIVFGNVIAD